MSNLSSHRRMILIVVLNLMTQWTEKWSANIYAVITVGKWHVTVAVSEVWSYVFSPNDAAGCSAVSLILILFLSSRQQPLSVRLKLVPLIHVSFKGEMINMWLQVGEQWSQRRLGMTLHGLVSHLLVWSICWAFLCMVPWQMKGSLQRHISFGAGTSNCRL